MGNFKKIQDVVEIILKEEPLTREDDMYLYYLYCTKYGFVNSGSFHKIFQDKEYRSTLGISGFETISRCRRKLQAEDPSFKSSQETLCQRLEQEKKIEGYVK
jgi:hypothetical protein